MEANSRIFRVLDESRLESVKYPIQPADIIVSGSGSSGLRGTFGNMEVERSAEHLVHFFIRHGYWCHFRLDELERFYRGRGWSTNAPFFGLMGAWFNDGGMMSWCEPLDVFIACASDGTYCVTDRFVERCASKIPA